MKLPVMLMVVALVAALCSAQPVVPSEPEQPHTSGHLRLKRQALWIINSGECPKGRIKVKKFCMDEGKYWQAYHDSDPEQPHTSGVLRLKRQAPKPAIMNGGQSECAKGQIKVNNFCMDEHKYWEMKGDSDNSEPEQPRTSEVLRLKRQAITEASGQCPPGQTEMMGHCLSNDLYWESKGEYDDSQEE